jgi:hypothetical protein
MTTLSEVLDFALAQRGKPYVWGGTGPSGYDCSGLVEKAFAAAGITLPRTSQEQRNAGTAVDLSDIQTGDIVTFTYNDGASDPGPGNHVALYLSAGQVIEAARPGVPIRVAPLDVAHIDRVRRIIGSSTASGSGASDASATSATATSSAPGLQQAGYDAVVNLTPWGIPLNPFKLPGYLAGKLGGAAASGAEGEVSSLADSLGPLILAATGVAAGAALLILGVFVAAKPAIDSGLQTAGEISNVK